MASRSGSSSSRSTGGTNTAGNPLDTVVVIGGDGRKKVLTLSWSYGANGAGIIAASLPLYGRLLVIAGVDASGYLAGGNLPVGIAADIANNGIANFGGRIVFDLDVQLANGGSGQQLSFPDTGNDGWVGTESGPLTIILSAPVKSDNSAPVNVVGKLTVQFDNSYSATPADGPPGYPYTPVSTKSH